MLKKEPQAFMLHQVNLHNRVLSASLTDEMDMPEDTSRRWLQDMTGEQCIIKVHGDALSHSFNDTSSLDFKGCAQQFKNEFG